MAIISGASTQGVSIPKQTTVLSVIEDMDPVLGRLENLANRAMGCADRVTGPRPQAVGEEAAKDQPSGLIASAQYRRLRLVRIVDDLEGEIQRMESAIS